MSVYKKHKDGSSTVYDKSDESKKFAKDYVSNNMKDYHHDDIGHNHSEYMHKKTGHTFTVKHVRGPGRTHDREIRYHGVNTPI